MLAAMTQATANATALPPAVTGMLPDELESSFIEIGEPKYRARQLLEWVYEKRVTRYEDMTNLGKPLREKLADWRSLTTMECVTVQGSRDTTRKFLFRLKDGRYVETVLIPASPALYGSASDRRTACVSSQVGCAYGCKFCASGLAGFTRNLGADEIVEQLLQVELQTGEKINNIVFMGMGEPLANLPNVMRAIKIINSDWGMHIGARHMTISTSGLAPEIKELADQPLQIRLAISLHGATDEVRQEIMPINRKYPLAELFEALHYYAERKKQLISFEFILIENVNDSLSQARELAERAKEIGAKVNLIPYNTVEGLPWKRPEEPQQLAFLKVLQDAGIKATLRREKGHDIDAACGQLRLKQETADAS
ncbi:MAG: 23S rRNA (adenine2503-C2)-methyltransferase [Verrucomicrobiales bacterium]|jgi:23S rRNA (adenine2503-C2)-methyltransferase